MKEIIEYIFASLSGLFWVTSVIYTFIVWGTGWGIVSIFFPIFPLIDLVKYGIQFLPWIK